MLKQHVACFDYIEPLGLSWWNLKQLARVKLVTYAFDKAHMQVCTTVMQKFEFQFRTQVLFVSACRLHFTVRTQRSQNVAVSHI